MADTNEYGFADQMEGLGFSVGSSKELSDSDKRKQALSRRPGFRSLDEAKGQVSQEEIMAGVDNAASFLVPFYDAGVNVSNVIDEYMKPEDERNYDYINEELGKAGTSAATEAAMMLAGFGAIKYGGKAISALKNKIKDYEIDTSTTSAFGVGAIRKKDTFEEVMTPVKVTKKGTKKTGESILRPSSDLAEDLDPRLKRAMSAETAGSIMPGPGKFFDPSKRGYKGDKFVGMLKDADIELDLEFGNYIMMGKGKPQDVSNETFENLFVSARPSQKKTTFGKNNKSVARANLYDGPSLSIADMKANYKAATGKTGVEVRTNLLQPERFSMVTDEGKRSLDHPIVAVQSMSGKKDHFYTLDTQFVGPVRMDRLTKKSLRTNKDTGKVTEEVPQPNLRPATVGDINLGEQVGTIKVGKREHPLYDYIEVDASKAAPKDMGSIPKFNQGGKVMNMQKQMSLFEYGGVADDGMKKDPVSGNDIPPGSLAKEVRDDIPAMLSEGEYVVPADVLRYYGVNFFENLRNKAKQGLSSMEQNGRIGGEPLTPQQIQQNMSGAPQAGAPAPMPVQANQGVLTMPDEYTQQAQMLGGGGFNPADWATVGGSYFNPELQGGQAPQESVTSFKTFVNAQTGEKKVVQYVNNKVTPESDEKFTQAPYYPDGSAALKKAQEQSQQSTGDDDSGPTPPPTGDSGSIREWGQDVDWTDPLAYAKTLDNTKTDKMGNLILKGAAAFGPAALIGAGVAQTGMGLQKISDLNAAAIIARAQGLDDAAEKIESAVKEYSSQSNLAVQFLDDLFATGNKKAESALNRMGLKFTRDEKTGKIIINDKDKADNLKRVQFYQQTQEETKQIQAGGGATGDDDGPTVITGGGVASKDDPTVIGNKYIFEDGELTPEEEAENDAIFDAIDEQFKKAGVKQNKGGLMTKAKKKK